MTTVDAFVQLQYNEPHNPVNVAAYDAHADPMFDENEI